MICKHPCMLACALTLPGPPAAVPAHAGGAGGAGGSLQTPAAAPTRGACAPCRPPLPASAGEKSCKHRTCAGAALSAPGQRRYKGHGRAAPRLQGAETTAGAVVLLATASYHHVASHAPLVPGKCSQPQQLPLPACLQVQRGVQSAGRAAGRQHGILRRASQQGLRRHQLHMGEHQ